MLHSSDVVTAIANAWGVKPTEDQKYEAAIKINSMVNELAIAVEQSMPLDFAFRSSEHCLNCRIHVCKELRLRYSRCFMRDRKGVTTGGAHAQR